MALNALPALLCAGFALKLQVPRILVFFAAIVVMIAVLNAVRLARRKGSLRWDRLTVILAVVGSLGLLITGLSVAFLDRGPDVLRWVGMLSAGQVVIALDRLRRS